MERATLIFFCGKMGAGKSTQSKVICDQRNAILISEDHWLSKLYPNEIKIFQDYIHYSSLLKTVIKPLVVSMLEKGVNIVMDFPANTLNQRSWFKGIISESGAKHELIYLDVSDQKCLKQIAKRRIENPERADFDNEEVFYQVTQYFQPPEEKEDFNITKIRND